MMRVSSADLALVLGVTDRRVRQLENAGVLRKLEHGEWDLAESVQSYLRHKLQTEARKRSRGSAAGSADERLKEMKTRREELRLAREEHELVPLADAIFAMDQVAGAVALEVNNIPARYTRDLDERDRLRHEIDAALTKVANRIGKCAKALRQGGEADPAVEEDDA
jgi:phage terminase Nu1 subunit (DNA packaging protein)